MIAELDIYYDEGVLCTKNYACYVMCGTYADKLIPVSGPMPTQLVISDTPPDRNPYFEVRLRVNAQNETFFTAKVPNETISVHFTQSQLYATLSFFLTENCSFNTTYYLYLQ
jgi:hypothetical protein